MPVKGSMRVTIRAHHETLTVLGLGIRGLGFIGFRCKGLDFRA